MPRPINPNLRGSIIDKISPMMIKISDDQIIKMRYIFSTVDASDLALQIAYYLLNEDRNV
ncbi:hypothetical protein GCM10007162_09680 [Ignatzschineria ureiclastica]|nr:hypothetical protein GCM10007162_09680 [Ignatzschineria ureiclastica]